MIDTIIGIILTIISLLILMQLCKGKSWDYKTRIRVYCATYHGDIYYVNTIRKYVERYIEDFGGEKKKEIKIIIKYMSKLKYSLMQEI